MLQVHRNRVKSAHNLRQKGAGFNNNVLMNHGNYDRLKFQHFWKCCLFNFLAIFMHFYVLTSSWLVKRLFCSIFVIFEIISIHTINKSSIMYCKLYRIQFLCRCYCCCSLSCIPSSLSHSLSLFLQSYKV